MGSQWDEVLARLRQQMTAAMFQVVFAWSQAVVCDGNVVEITFPNEQAYDWAEQRLRMVLQRTVREVYGPTVELRCVLKTRAGEPAAAAGLSAGSAPDSDERMAGAQIEDRRQRFYIIDNVVMDEYLPVMGLKAYAVYSLYCRMAREDLAWPGFEYICRVLRIGRSTLAECNRTLEALGLIEVARGDSERSNRYYLLQVQPLSPERVRDSVQRAQGLGLERVVEALGVVLNGDYPSPEPGPPQSSTGTTPVLNQDYPSPERGLEQDPLNKTQEQDPLTRDMRIDAELVEMLVSLGMARRVAMRLLEQNDRRAVLEVAQYARGQPRLKNPAGFIVKRLRERSEAVTVGDGEGVG